MIFNYKLHRLSYQQSIAMALFVFLALALLSNPTLAQTKLWSFRGGQGLGPENTIEAIELALEAGAQGTEVDLWYAGVTQEDVVPEIVLTHFRDISRLTDGTGFIQDLSYDYLRTLDAGSTGSNPIPGAKIPRLSEALSVLRQNHADILLHIKTSPFGLPGTVPTGVIANALAEADFPEGNIYTWDDNLTRIQDYSTNIPGIQAIYQGDVDLDTVDWQALADMGVRGIQVRLDNQQFGGGKFNQDYIDAVHSNGFFAFINAPNGTLYRQAIGFGVDIVQTTNIVNFSRILEEEQAIVLGDCNFDGVVDFLDVSPFISVLATNAYLDRADVNQDDAVDFLDISPFLIILSN